MMDRVTEAALMNPVINAAHVEEARRVAWSEITVLMECVEHLARDHPEHKAILVEIQRIEQLPGMRNTP